MSRSNRPTDPLFNQQWYLQNSGQTGGKPGIDLNVLPIWQNYTGRDVQVAIVDDGVDYRHPDLNNNYNLAADVDTARRLADGAPILLSDNHGTAVAGLVAAERNEAGSVGIAYDATLSSIRLDFEAGSLDDTVFALRQFANFDVVNNSWGYGTPFIDNFAERDFAPFQPALEAAVEEGRDGLGTVVVFAGGNARAARDSANYHNLQNSRYSIAVAALDDQGDRTSYSSPGANLLVSAFGGDTNTDGIVSTDRVGRNGYATTDYTDDFGGTSAAAPMVTGVVALMLEANPNLGYRDVQEILVYSARQTDRQNSTWQTNGATNWNGGGLASSTDYGFGLVDAHAAVRLAETWRMQQTARNERNLQGDQPSAVTIRDNDTASSQIRLTGGLTIEQVEVEVDLTHTWLGDLELTLVSPNGTESLLMSRPSAIATQGLTDLQFTFSSAQFWGEQAAGNWTLRVSDRATADEGVLKNWSLRVYGDDPSPNDTYTYTDSFARVGSTASRTRLQDDGGRDTVNAAAVTSNLLLDLRPGIRNRIAGRSLTLTNGTQIEVAIGGDGNDRIRGNETNNLLTGGRGNDQLVGRHGRDRLLGGAGNDRLYGGADRDRLLGNSGNDILQGSVGDDLLTGGTGQDRFVLNASGAGVDRVTDFVSGTDKIVLNKAAFTNLMSSVGTGFSQVGEFASVSSRGAIATQSALIVYNESTGQVFYNANGRAPGLGGGSAVAILSDAPTLTANDFVLQA
ncbi:S8 family serine peptidase [Vacuolonema iberomarrocanum]|uniref:S8 family serine peptidase n=1 Tax=Vacuolonema iberomarrocanum TaxID=3454632 RepID=UPI0019EE395C|nr:S8 family serine peptidase [filamentous cyanobacterium LEGE 07170]